MSRTVALREIAHARAGDKGNRSNVAVFVFDPAHYEVLRDHLTAERLKNAFGALLTGPVVRHELAPARRPQLRHGRCAGRRRQRIAEPRRPREILEQPRPGAGSHPSLMTGSPICGASPMRGARSSGFLGDGGRRHEAGGGAVVTAHRLHGASIMRITRIAVYRKSLRYAGGAYAWGRGNVIETAGSTVVVIDTDAGLSGAGEFCPCGENYMVAHSEGVEAAARLLAPALLGEDPRQVGRVERLMDHVVRGHGYAKAAFDAACWDLLGKAVGQPVWMLLGGKLTEGAPLYRPAPQEGAGGDGARNGLVAAARLSPVPDSRSARTGVPTSSASSPPRRRCIRARRRWPTPTRAGAWTRRSASRGRPAASTTSWSSRAARTKNVCKRGGASSSR